MNIRSMLRRKPSHDTATTELVLNAVRFREVLENALDIRNLVEDGTEKLRGEYIFDRYYVVSLTDRVLEKMAKIVFDACVLAPEGGDVLYSLFDMHKRIAQREFLNNRTSSDRDTADNLSDDQHEDPEYRLLARILTWMTDGSGGRYPSVEDFVRGVLDHIMASRAEEGFSKTGVGSLRVETAGVENVIDLIDLGAGVRERMQGSMSFQDLHCRPFGMLLLGTEHCPRKTDSLKRVARRRWFAAVGN